MLKKFRYLVFLLFSTIQGCADVVPLADYNVGGANREALLCRPDGKGPFPAVVHNHGVGVDTAGYQRALRRGYDLPGICKELSTAGFLTFIPIRQGGPGLRNLPPHKAQVLEAIDYVKSLTDVDPSRLAVTGNSRGALLTLHGGLGATEFEGAGHHGAGRNWTEPLQCAVSNLLAQCTGFAFGREKR